MKYASECGVQTLRWQAPPRPHRHAEEYDCDNNRSDADSRKDFLMNTQLTEIITRLEATYGDAIFPESRFILEIDLGSEAERMGFGELGRRFRGVMAVVPVKSPVAGMKVLIDGRTFVDYAQYNSGIAVPGYVAREIDLPASPYHPDDSLIRQFN
jgi:hypothetical protein